MLSTSGRRTWIPAKIPQYSNDCLGDGKVCAREFFATDEMLPGTVRDIDLGFSEGSDPCEDGQLSGARRNSEGPDCGLVNRGLQEGSQEHGYPPEGHTLPRATLHWNRLEAYSFSGGPFNKRNMAVSAGNT